MTTMKFGFSVFSTLLATATSKQLRASDKVQETTAFWERELQGSGNQQFDACGFPLGERRIQILNILRTVSVPATLNSNGTPQKQAADWLIGSDAFFACPGDEKLIQRYVMAVFYYSTDGGSWTTCSAGDGACADTAYLSPVHECDWAGSACDADLCMTEIIFGTYLRTRGIHVCSSRIMLYLSSCSHLPYVFL